MSWVVVTRHCVSSLNFHFSPLVCSNDFLSRSFLARSIPKKSAPILFDRPATDAVKFPESYELKFHSLNCTSRAHDSRGMEHRLLFDYLSIYPNSRCTPIDDSTAILGQIFFYKYNIRRLQLFV